MRRKNVELLRIAIGLKMSTFQRRSRKLSSIAFILYSKYKLHSRFLSLVAQFSINFQLIRRIVEVARVKTKINENADGGHLVAVENLLGQ